MIERSSSNVIDFDPLQRPSASGGFMPTGGYHPRRFDSILFQSPADRIGDGALTAPAFFADLNCDQIINAVTAGKAEYDLKPFFHACLTTVDAIEYRHEVMRDLECGPLYEHVNSFAVKMREVREHVLQAQKMYYKDRRKPGYSTRSKFIAKPSNPLLSNSLL
jgi:hypothetical protein